MHNDEIDNFHQMIDESYLKVDTAKELHIIINEFFDRDYGMVSPEFKKMCENDFELRRLNLYADTGAIEMESLNKIFSKMRLYLHLILDKSVDLSKSEKSILEKIIGASPTININLLKK